MSAAGTDRKIALAYISLPHLTPPEFVSVAAAGGFDAVSVRLIPAHPQGGEMPFPMLGNSPMMAETLRRLDDTGVYVHDIEVVRLKPDTDVRAYLPEMEAATRLQARYFTAISDDDDEGRAADNLARLAEQAATFGMKTAFEFMLYIGIKTIGQASRVIDRTGRSDITLMIDPLHLHRSGGTVEDVRKIDPARLGYMQFCDASATQLPEAQGGIRIEARHHRMVPGTGALPLAGLLAAMPADAALSVECPVAELVGRIPDAEIARRLAVATRRLAAEDAAARQKN